jgi:hypothetical protein
MRTLNLPVIVAVTVWDRILVLYQGTALVRIDRNRALWLKFATSYNQALAIESTKFAIAATSDKFPYGEK